MSKKPPMPEVESIIKVYNAKTFEKEIEHLVIHEEFSFIEAMLHFCDIKDLEYTELKRLMTPYLKRKVLEEANEKRLRTALQYWG